MWLSLVCQASQAWMEWLMKKRKAFDQRGDMAIAAWAEQQQRELNLRARRLSRSKVLYWIKYLDKINHATKWVHKKLLHASSNSLFTDSHFMHHWNKLKQMEPLESQNCGHISRWRKFLKFDAFGGIFRLIQKKRGGSWQKKRRHPRSTSLIPLSGTH